MKCLFSFTTNNAGHSRISLQTFRSIIRYLRTTEPDRHIRPYLMQKFRQLLHHSHIPYITGKSDHIRFLLVKICQYIFCILIDRIFFDLNLFFIFIRKSPQTAHCQVGMNILGIDRCQHNLHSLSLSSFLHFYSMTYTFSAIMSFLFISSSSITRLSVSPKFRKRFANITHLL